MVIGERIDQQMNQCVDQTDDSKREKFFGQKVFLDELKQFLQRLAPPMSPESNKSGDRILVA